MRRMFLLLAKAAISGLLLYFSLRWVNIDAMVERLRHLEPGWLLLAVVLMATQLLPLSARWRQIAISCGTDMGFIRTLQINFIAAFFNQVLPSTVGGDGVRIWFAARRGAGWANATYSVLLDRIFGVFVLALVVAACLPWTLQLIREPVPRAVLLVLACGAIAGPLIVLLAGTHFYRWLRQWTVTRHVAAAAEAAARTCGSPRSAAIVIGCSVIIHLLTISAAWCCVKAVAAPVGFAHVLFLMPPVLLIATVPISIAGWGVRESSMIAAFAYAGLPESDGLTLSVLFGAASFVIGIIGGIVWISSEFRTKTFDSANDEMVTGRP
jgi:uncharacterized membrane protein YbhN (UPF0104 family)